MNITAPLNNHPTVNGRHLPPLRGGGAGSRRVVLTITKLKGAEYLIASVADGMEDYYMGAGEAPGVWQDAGRPRSGWRVSSRPRRCGRSSTASIPTAGRNCWRGIGNVRCVRST